MTKEGYLYHIKTSASALREGTAQYLNHSGFSIDDHLLYSCFAKDEKVEIKICNNE
jgi:hypothetical protein